MNIFLFLNSNKGAVFHNRRASKVLGQRIGC